MLSNIKFQVKTSLLFFTLLFACQGEVEEEVPFVQSADSVVTILETPEEIVGLDTLEIDSVLLDTTAIPPKIEKPKRKPAQMKFETTVHRYDTIQQGDVIEYAFRFKNIGERPLVITSVKGSCGCTIGSYPFLDIAPNESEVIKARFDSKGKKGAQKTTITVLTANASPKSYKLTLEGFVKE